MVGYRQEKIVCVFKLGVKIRRIIIIIIIIVIKRENLSVIETDDRKGNDCKNDEVKKMMVC